MEFLNISIISWAALLVTLTTAVIAMVMLVLGSTRLHYLWGIFCFFVGLWSLAFFFVTQAQTPETARFLWKIAYIGIILNPVVFLHFALEFAKRMNYLFVIIAYLVGIMFVYFDMTTNLIVDQMRLVFGFYYDSPAGQLNPLLVIFFVILVTIAHIAVFLSYKKSNDINFKQRTEYFFLATSIGFVGAGLNFFPAYGIDINPVTIVTVIIAWPLIAYAILRYGLFNIRIVTAQLLTLVLTIFALIHIVLSESRQEFILNALLLLTTFLVGIYLIRSVSTEVKHREEIEQLAKNLKEANERLKELDKLKSQFLSIASHDLRAPLTTIRNFMSLLLDGTYGKIPQAAEEGMHQVFERATEMAKSVDDYLNVSRIEQGRMKYDFAETDVVKIVSETATSFKSIAEKKGLSLSFRGPADLKEIPVKADAAKLHEVLSLLIDNSIKYTPKGSIQVTVEQSTGGNKKLARITIKDTGVGISKETMPKLFKLFSTGAESAKVNTSSTGVGLYVVKAIIEAHKGTVRAESEGEGKGSTFIVELPVAG